MKKIAIYAMMTIMAVLLASCKDKKEPVAEAAPEVPQEVYQPVDGATTVDLAATQRYHYFDAPMSVPATGVEVSYNQKAPYKDPIVVTFSYANKDTYAYTIPAEFGLWKNSVGRWRVVTDDKCTVWLQGQTKSGRLREFVFYGDPQYNGTKIKPNSYRNPPTGEIRYR